MQKKHKLLGLVTDSALQESLSSLLPDYEFHWNLSLKGAINAAADLRPSALILDADDSSTEWEPIVLGLMSNPATRRIPVLGITTNAESAQAIQSQAAKSFGGLLMRSELNDRLTDWVAKRARMWKDDYYAALAERCSDPLPAAAQEGIRLFNAREFWEAHEVLEGAWLDANGHPIGEVYRAILQVGVAYYQIQRGNYRGAIKMFLRSVQWLDPLPDTCQGIDIAQFKQDAAAARTALEALTADTIATFDAEAYFKHVPMIQ